MPRWTPEARAAQAARIRAWKPWLNSTGPRTVAGKERCRMNAEKTGAFSADARREKLYADALLLLARAEARAEAVEAAARQGRKRR